MPYDGVNFKYDLTLASFIAWLETKPPEEEYCWPNTQTCLIAQFSKACEAPYIVVSQILSRQLTGGYSDDHLEEIAFDIPRTYGAALKRVKELAG